MRYVFALLILLFSVSTCFALTQICDEDFEGQSEGAISELDPTGSGEISRSGRAFYHLTQHFDDADPRGFVDLNDGDHEMIARAEVGPYTANNSYDEPKWRFDNLIGGSIYVYFKWDMRMGASLCGDNPVCAIEEREFWKYKLFKIGPEETAAAGTRGGTLNLTPNSQYSWYGWGGNEYYFTNAETNIANTIWGTDWHTFEVFIELGTYISSSSSDFSVSNDTTVKLWIDDVLVLEDYHVPIRLVSNDNFDVINSIAFVREVQGTVGYPLVGGNLDFDNIEVWDGMPSWAGENNTASLTIYNANGSPVTYNANGSQWVGQ